MTLPGPGWVKRQAHTGLHPAYLSPGTGSFADFLAAAAPDLLPGRAVANLPTGQVVEAHAPHGTTIVTLTIAGGVVMAGDRRATMGHLIAARDLDKVFLADDTSAIGIAGMAGLALELVKLYQVELEHYEKIEGTALSLEGKANRLATMIRGNLGLALQGMVVLPVFAGYDAKATKGRIFSYDLAGGCYEERDHHSVGSGSMFARGALKKLWAPGMTADQGVRVGMEALYDAADDDTGTGGPDLGRRIWPSAAIVDAGGARMVPSSARSGTPRRTTRSTGSGTTAPSPTSPGTSWSAGTPNRSPGGCARGGRRG